MADAVLERYIDQNTNDADAWMLYGQMLYRRGLSEPARAIFRNYCSKANSPHVSDVLHAKHGAVVAVVDDVRKILYIPIPKCANTTVKNYIYYGLTGESCGLMVHEKLSILNRVVFVDELTNKYNDYFKFSVIRDWKQRIVSYLQGNIERGYLRKSSFGREFFCGISTSPSIDDVHFSFFKYRQYFLDFRHHTDPMSWYIPNIEALDALFNMDSLDDVRAFLEWAYQVKIPTMHEMKSGDVQSQIKMSPDMDKFYEIDEKISLYDFGAK
ncbi:sulfotransferase family 2 domain-containing protein [Agrobacterium rubi]|uniref:Sulfotransferase family 2 domain-containing protein n=1 Tax=Agrobacterium rubi TaxID=28099 RepID=A0AAE7R8U5_9HYPH|nr:sulfotransferase family 2 domain-containing protein [Agrobacterium rubi]NTE87884.1 sulfotransferase family 2 domain-containing protein [Agrobacterium rubi]NTF05118.1 sulfotransferase family 2 domain-containing protein [Agrobacterium rubi]NTF37977.1 sulfotransferase family 2 domain-containing protein [Agrobacterium rubi]QTG01832.1 sulfotransferase family 2 domain-containing protein [Agrobacterium rubi]